MVHLKCCVGDVGGAKHKNMYSEQAYAHEHLGQNECYIIESLYPL